MKRILSAVVVGMAVMANAVFGMQEKDPKAILDKMSETYKAMAGYKFDFAQEVVEDAEVIDGFNGSVSVAKESFLVKLRDQHIYSDGKVIHTYLVESQELTISNFDPDESFINPSNVYDIYKEGFEYKYLRSDKVGEEAVDVIELTATDPDSDYTNVTLYIGVEDSYLKGWDLVDFDGIVSKFVVSKFTANIEFEESHFKFDSVLNPVAYTTDLRN